jgi:hypothetical protein
MCTKISSNACIVVSHRHCGMQLQAFWNVIERNTEIDAVDDEEYDACFRVITGAYNVSAF